MSDGGTNLDYMSDENKQPDGATAGHPNAETHRPVDLGLSEGKSLTFSPTAVMVPIDTPAIGGTSPSPAPPEANAAGHDVPPLPAAPAADNGQAD
jgi:hypothetical protein